MFAASNTGAHTSLNERPSGFVKRSVSTSFGLLFRKVTTCSRYAGVQMRRSTRRTYEHRVLNGTCNGPAIEKELVSEKKSLRMMKGSRFDN